MGNVNHTSQSYAPRSRLRIKCFHNLQVRLEIKCLHNLQCLGEVASHSFLGLVLNPCFRKFVMRVLVLSLAYTQYSLSEVLLVLSPSRIICFFHSHKTYLVLLGYPGTVQYFSANFYLLFQHNIIFVMLVIISLPKAPLSFPGSKYVDGIHGTMFVQRVALHFIPDKLFFPSRVVY